MQKDFVEKANSFANWFTSILISNFIYLVRLGEAEGLDNPGKWSFGFSLSSLVFIFPHKALGVCAAKKRHALVSQDKTPDDTFLNVIPDSPCIHKIETFRTRLFYLFVAFGMFAVLFSGFILWFELTKPRVSSF